MVYIFVYNKFIFGERLYIIFVKKNGGIAIALYAISGAKVCQFAYIEKFYVYHLNVKYLCQEGLAHFK